MNHPGKPQAALRIMQRLTAAAAVAAAGLTIAHTIMLYTEGRASGGQVYTAERIAAHFGAVGWPLALFGVLLLATAIMSLFIRREGEHAAPQSVTDTSPMAGRHLPLIRCVVLAAAALLIVLGILNGGMYDVLVKAINICTECIGLG